MTSHPPQDFSDTVQIVTDGDPVDSNAPTGTPPADFSETVQIEDETEVWAEAPDFQSSESASLFAGTQPAPLPVV
jgi:hypothetical protein